MTKVYKAKVSYGLLIIIFLLFFVPVIFGVINNGINPQFYKMMMILLPFYAFVLHLFFKTEYKIENEYLQVKSGFLFNQSIKISEIKKINKTSSLMSSPAPSFDRIVIKYGKYEEIILSPQDKVSFAKDLVIINSEIENFITEN